MGVHRIPEGATASGFVGLGPTIRDVVLEMARLGLVSSGSDRRSGT
jgi:hypothetical protein